MLGVVKIHSYAQYWKTILLGRDHQEGGDRRIQASDRENWRRDCESGRSAGP